MGLDIAFNRKDAIASGLVLSHARTGTDEEIARAIAEEQSPDYLAYLNRVEELVHVPGTDYLTDNGGVDDIVIRANKWGPLYGPMTTWLKTKGIDWSEF